MRNFNTNQARHLYVAKAKKNSVEEVKAVGDIYVGKDNSDNLFFVYMNGDGLITRSDTIPASGVEYANKKDAVDLKKPLMAHTIKLSDEVKNSLADLVGKRFRMVVFVRQFIGFDENDAVAVNVELFGTKTNTASESAFLKALADAIALAMPKKDVPYFKVFFAGKEVTKKDVAAGTGDLVLVATAQKWSRGKMSNAPMMLTVQFNLDVDGDDLVWGTDTVAESKISGYESISGDYELADLEYFCYGERGDIYRGSNWPNDVQPTYLIDPAANTGYSVVTVQYAWSGKAENVQKSPRTIQVAAPASVAGEIYTALTADLPDGVATVSLAASAKPVTVSK